MIDDILSLFSFPETDNPDQKAIDWLLGHGVNIMAIASPWPVLAGRIVLQPDGRYVPCPIGDFAYIFAIIDDGIIDATAWLPSSRRMATRLGTGACLGEGQVGCDGLGTTGCPLPVWRSPLGWLKADRCGLVIVDQELAAHRLAGLHLKAEDHKHATELRQQLRLPLPTILIPKQKRLAA